MVNDLRPLASRVERQLDRLARQMLNAFIVEIPLYGQLPKEQLEGEILDILRFNLNQFFETLSKGEELSAADLDVIRASAARRAEERIPLQDVLTAYHLGASMGWEALVAVAVDDEKDLLLDAAGRLIRYVQTVTTAVSGAYLEERQAIFGEERDARRALAEALLSGLDPRSLAERVGHNVAHGYVAVALQVDPSADEQQEEVSAAVAGRRKVRRLEQQLLSLAGPASLSLMTPTGGTVLLPQAGEDPADAMGAVPKLVEALAEAAGAPIVAGMAYGKGPIGIEEAGREAREVVRLATEQDRPPGTYKLDDLLFEYVITRPSPAADRLVEVLTPLDSGPELIATLEGYFAANFDRRKAAAALHVHPNTLDYRLRRVGELTGLSVQTSQGVQVLGAALTIRRLRRQA